MSGNRYVLGYNNGGQFVTVKISYNYRMLIRQKALLQKNYNQILEIKRLSLATKNILNK